MKLYTEEQVRDMLNTFLFFTGNGDANDYIEYMTPIKLPTAVEVEVKAQDISEVVTLKQGAYIKYETFLKGANWVINQIKQQSK